MMFTNTLSWHDYAYTFAQTFIAVTGIVVTTVISIRNIRKAAEESRITTIHNEMAKCLADTITIIEKVIKLLYDVGNNVTYHDIKKNIDIETAHERYWREIGELSSQFKNIHARQKLYFPKELYDHLQEIIIYLNNTRDLARDPSSDELTKILVDIYKSYEDFIDKARSYIGSHKLGKISGHETVSLGSNEK